MSDFHNPVVSGLTHAMSLAAMFQRMSMEQEQMERQKHKDKRNEQMEDLDLQGKLLSAGGKGVSQDGRVTQQIQLPQIADLSQYGIENGPASMATSVPADPSRVIRTPDGRQYYMPTDDERFADSFDRKMQELRAVTDVKTQGAIATNNARLQGQLAIEDVRQSGANTRTDRTNQTRKEEGAANRDNQRGIAVMNEKGRNVRAEYHEKNANARTNASNATSTANSIRSSETQREVASGKGKNGQMTESAKRAELQKIEHEEYGVNGQPGIHGQLENIGIVLRSGKQKDREGKEVALSADERKKLDAKAKLLTTRRDQLMKRKRELGFQDDKDPLGLLK